MSRLPSDRVALLVAGPPVLLAALSVTLIGLGWLGANPFWRASTLTLSEATAMRDRAAVVVMLEQGVDPYLEYPIRAGLVGERGLVVTPMGAAIQEDRPEMVELLLAHGVEATPARICSWLGEAGESKEEVGAFLRHRYPTESAGCGSGVSDRAR